MYNQFRFTPIFLKKLVTSQTGWRALKQFVQTAIDIFRSKQNDEELVKLFNSCLDALVDGLVIAPRPLVYENAVLANIQLTSSVHGHIPGSAYEVKRVVDVADMCQKLSRCAPFERLLRRCLEYTTSSASTLIDYLYTFCRKTSILLVKVSGP